MFSLKMSFDINWTSLAPSFIPCNHYSVYVCDCLTQEQKTGLLFRFHKEKECNFNPHAIFQGNGYYPVKKPTWTNSCNCPYDEDDPFVQKVQMLSAFCNFNCKCTTFDICSLCRNMLLISDADIDEREDKKWSHCLEALSCVCTTSTNSSSTTSSRDDVG
jgi:hypothetical protein